MPLQGDSMPAPHAGAPNRSGSRLRSTMAPGLPRSGRGTEYGMSMRRPGAATGGGGRR